MPSEQLKMVCHTLNWFIKKRERWNSLCTRLQWHSKKAFKNLFSHLIRYSDTYFLLLTVHKWHRETQNMIKELNGLIVKPHLGDGHGKEMWIVLLQCHHPYWKKAQNTWCNNVGLVTSFSYDMDHPYISFIIRRIKISINIYIKNYLCLYFYNKPDLVWFTILLLIIK